MSAFSTASRIALTGYSVLSHRLPVSGVDDRSGFHVAHTECHRLGKHVGDGAFHTLVIEETCSAVGSITDFRAGNDNTGNTQLRAENLADKRRNSAARR